MAEADPAYKQRAGSVIVYGFLPFIQFLDTASTFFNLPITYYTCILFQSYLLSIAILLQRVMDKAQCVFAHLLLKYLMAKKVASSFYFLSNI